MSATNWDQETDFLIVSKRAKGRDRYNAQRSASAEWRRYEASKLLEVVGFPLRWGWQSDLARRLGVHRSTICRDFISLKRAAQLDITVEEFEADRRLGWRLDRWRRLGLRW